MSDEGGWNWKRGIGVMILIAWLWFVVTIGYPLDGSLDRDPDWLMPLYMWTAMLPVTMPAHRAIVVFTDWPRLPSALIPAALNALWWSVFIYSLWSMASGLRQR